LNTETDSLILKGGTALMMCYGLDRFSEDVDFDASSKMDSLQYVGNYCNKMNYEYRVAKKTDTTERAFIHYGSDSHPLKVETSFRLTRTINQEDVLRHNGINVYSINALCNLKTLAYTGRDKIRDLYDISFITNNYFDELNNDTKNNLRNALAYKGMEYFDYVTETQKDDLIDNSILAESYLNMFDKLDILSEEESARRIS
jgi:predicted nucleotidyltransferase component of viral defense system